MRPAIRAFNLGKRYLRTCEFEGRLIPRFRNVRNGVPVWALRNCTFDIHSGELVGIIGANGAGKSTLLKLLCRITRPNEGGADIYGRVGALLEVGTGFHPELTGRENVYLNGSLIGMNKQEIHRNLDAIVDFAGVAEWLDTPIKRYSSGMKVRLAFAVAAHLQQEIMILDEVLAVGDSAFRAQCFKRISEITKDEGRTVLLVSHEMPSIATTCSRAIWLEAGRIRGDGKASAIIDSYLRSVPNNKPSSQGFGSVQDTSANAIRFRYVRLYDATGRQVPSFLAGQPVQIAIGFEASDPTLLRRAVVTLTIYNSRRQPLAVCGYGGVADAHSCLPQAGEFKCEIENWRFVPGKYTIDIACRVGETVLTKIANAADIAVTLNESSAARCISAPGLGDVLLDYHWGIHDGAELCHSQKGNNDASNEFEYPRGQA